MSGSPRKKRKKKRPAKDPSPTSEGERERGEAAERKQRKKRREREAPPEEGEEEPAARVAKRKGKKKRPAPSDEASDDLGRVSSGAFGVDSEPSAVGKGEIGGRSVAQLKQDLASSSARKREAAVHLLGKLGPGAAAAAGALGGLLSDESDAVRLRAARALGKIGPGAIDAVPALVEALAGDDDDDKSLSGVCAKALKRIGPLAWPALLDVLDDKRLRRKAAKVLRSIPPGDDAETLEAMEALLDPGREKAASVALTVLEKLGAEGVPLMLVVASADDAPELQEKALEALAGVGEQAVKPLLAALRREDPALRVAAAQGLAELARGEEAKAVAKASKKLGRALEDEDAGVRAALVETLGALKGYPLRAEEALIPALGDSDPRVGLAAVMAMLDLAKDKAKLAARMAQVVASDEREFVRVGACMVLMHLGQDARASVPALLQAIEDASTEVREYAHLALQGIRTPSMRVEVIRTASMRLQVLPEGESGAEDDEDEEDELSDESEVDEDDEDEDEDESDERPRAPTRKKKRRGVAPRKRRRIRRRR